MFNTLKQNEKTVIGDTIQQLQALKIKVNGGNGAIGEVDKIRVGQDGSLTFALKCELKLRVKR